MLKSRIAKIEKYLSFKEKKIKIVSAKYKETPEDKDYNLISLDESLICKYQLNTLN